MKWSIAANTFIWHSPLSNSILRERLPKLADWGFDAVELPLEHPGDWDGSVAKRLLEEHQLSSVVGAVFGPGCELAAADETVTDNAVRYMRAAIDLCAEQGSSMVIGPAYCSVGRTWQISLDERRHLEDDLVLRYQELGMYAGARGVKIAIEPLNRYETSVFNTTQQLLEVIERVDSPYVGINLDTYHMNIEERSFGEPIRHAGKRLFHLQVCGNDRGAPGQDLTDWHDVFSALVDINYNGLLGIESFTSDNASIAVAASIWRPLAASQDELATTGLAFLATMREQYAA